MNINTMITTLKRDVIRAFATLDSWFDKDESFFHYEPPEQNRVLEIMNRTQAINSQLLSLINNGCKEALREARMRETHLTTEAYVFKGMSIEDPAIAEFLNKLHDVKNDSSNSLESIREELRDQLYRSLCQLELLRNGEGALHGLSLHDTHKIDIYQLIHLLSVNVWKSVVQLKKLEGIITGH
jgi:hypothetical protein